MQDDAHGAARARARHLPAAADGPRPPRGAARRREPRASLADRGRADVGRYAADVEAAVYFCCLEALQNAGKHAGEGRALTVDASRGSTTRCWFDGGRQRRRLRRDQRRASRARLREHGRPRSARSAERSMSTARRPGTRIYGHIKQPARCGRLASTHRGSALAGNTSWAALHPHMPCTPPPGGVDEEQRYRPGEASPTGGARGPDGRRADGGRHSTADVAAHVVRVVRFHRGRPHRVASEDLVAKTGSATRSSPATR